MKRRRFLKRLLQPDIEPTHRLSADWCYNRSECFRKGTLATIGEYSVFLHAIHPDCVVTVYDRTFNIPLEPLDLSGINAL